MATRKNSGVRRLIVWIPSIAWMMLIFMLSSRQRIAVEGGFWLNFLIFKSLHVLEYAILTLLNLYALRSSLPRHKITTLGILSVALSLIFAASDELHQSFVPTRQGQATDVLIDAIGIFSVYSLVTKYEKSS